MKKKAIDINGNSDPDLFFQPRKSDRRQTESTICGEFYTRKVGTRVVAGKNRRKSDRRNDLIDTTHITLWETNLDGSRYKII